MKSLMTASISSVNKKLCHSREKDSRRDVGSLGEKRITSIPLENGRLQKRLGKYNCMSGSSRVPLEVCSPEFQM